MDHIAKPVLIIGAVSLALLLMVLILLLFGRKNPDMRYDATLDDGPWWLVLFAFLGRLFFGWWLGW